MKLLLGVIALRSVAWFGLITFVPPVEVALGHSKSHGNHLLALMLFAGGAGTLLLGPLADRVGRRPVLLGKRRGDRPLILVFVVVGGIPGAIALALIGACVVGTVRRHDGDGAVSTCRATSALPPVSWIGLSVGIGGVAAVALDGSPTRRACAARSTSPPPRRCLRSSWRCNYRAGGRDGGSKRQLR